MKFVFISILIAQVYMVATATCHKLYSKNPNPTNNFIRNEMLDSKGKYWLEWTVDWKERSITFNITAETTGWVGFGLSNNGKMSGADVIIGGMYDNGLPYISDMHAVSGQMPLVDQSQDWTLLDCFEDGRHTFLSVKRKLNTCDAQDYPITENRVSLIWAYGKEDRRIWYHEQSNRGSYDVYLLDPNWAPGIVRHAKSRNPSIRETPGLDILRDLKTWTIARNVIIPKNATSYLCSMHKAPSLSRKHHVIGFDVHFANEESRKRVHHLSIFKCHVPTAWVPEGTTPKSLFGQYVGGEPQACTNLLNPFGGPIPTQWCTEIYIFWAFGGRTFFNPEHVGFPLGNNLGEEEFYLVQIHYDNPEKLQNILVEQCIDLFYTSNLRPNEGGLLTVIHQIPGEPESFLLPPNSRNHRIFGHCSAECTNRILGARGNIKMYAAVLHSHISGKQLRLHHFRGGKELPWILYDDNWTNGYQQFRNMRREIEVMPGDQLTIDCVYDTTWANGSSVVGGYATTQDMCATFIFYYNRIVDYHYCASQLRSIENRQRFLNGVGNVTWSQDELGWVVSDPSKWKGLTIQQVSDHFVEWDERTRAELQKEHTYHSQVGTCYREAYSRTVARMPFSQGVTEDDFLGPVGYPLDAVPYFSPEPQCNY